MDDGNVKILISQKSKQPSYYASFFQGLNIKPANSPHNVAK
jgi:hypothetical protein